MIRWISSCLCFCCLGFAQLPPAAGSILIEPTASRTNPAPSSATNTVSNIRRLHLEEAINYALGRNRDLGRQSSLLRSSYLGVRGADAEFDFRIRPSGSVGVGNDTGEIGSGMGVVKRFHSGTEIELRGRYQNNTTSDDDIDDLHRGTASIEITQPLFRNFGSLVHNESRVVSRESLRDARRGYERAKADLVLEVVEAFAALIRLERQIQADQRFFERMKLLYDRTEAFERQQKSTRIDVLRVELELGQSEARLTNSRERRDFQMFGFSDLLGFPPETRFLLEPPPVLSLSLLTTEQSVGVALSNRLDYAEVLDEVTTATRKIAISERRLWPDLSLVTRYDRFSEGTSAGDAVGFDEDGWFIGLSAGSDLNQSLERVGIGQSRISRDIAMDSVRIFEVAISRNILQQQAVVRRTKAEENIAARNADLARQKADLAKRRYDLGQIDNFTLIDAEEEWIEADNALYAAQAATLISGYRFLRILGTLIEYPGDLKPRKTR